MAEPVPIRRPAEIRRVDVGRQPLLETVKLIRPAEMHLAGKDGLITGVAQVMGECRHIGGELGRIVVGADGRRQPSRHEDVAGRRAERAVAVGGLESDAAGRQRIDIRRLGRSAAIGREHAGGKLIRHQYQYVRPTCHFLHAPLLFPVLLGKNRTGINCSGFHSLALGIDVAPGSGGYSNKRRSGGTRSRSSASASTALKPSVKAAGSGGWPPRRSSQWP